MIKRRVRWRKQRLEFCALSNLHSRLTSSQDPGFGRATLSFWGVSSTLGESNPFYAEQQPTPLGNGCQEEETDLRVEVSGCLTTFVLRLSFEQAPEGCLFVPDTR